MNRNFALRLTLDALALSVFMTALAYYWLGNATHEVLGLSFFLFLATHNVINRRWYGVISKAKAAPRNVINMLSAFLLAGACVALLITSVAISETLLSALALKPGYTARQIHAFSAYWILVFAGIHVGIRWPMIMGRLRLLSAPWANSKAFRYTLKALALALVVQGVCSSFTLHVGSRLLLQPSLDWWDFEQSRAGFFLHCLAISGLYIVVTCQGLKLLPSRAAEQ